MCCQHHPASSEGVAPQAILEDVRQTVHRLADGAAVYEGI